MFSSHDHFRRRVSVSHQQGALFVRIERHNNWKSNTVTLVAMNIMFLLFLIFLFRPLLRRPFTLDVVYDLPLLAFFMLGYLIMLRIGTWRAFGVEQIVVDAGLLSWTRTAPFWVRKVEIPLSEITDIKAIKPWHSLSNHVELKAQKQNYKIGDMLLQDETTELAQKLRHAVGLLTP